MTQTVALQITAAEREALFLELYQRVFPAVARYVSRRGGSLEEAKDVFQDAVVLFYEKLVGQPQEEISNRQGYLLGIAKHLWAKRHQTSAQLVPLDQLLPAAETAPLDPPLPSTQKLLRFLEKAGHKCMELLRAVYYDQLNTTEVATAFGFSGERSATVQKYKCLEKVRNTVREKSINYDDFYE